MKEAELTKKIRLTASRLGLTLLRNNSGAFYDKKGNFVRFGLGNESKRVNDEIKTSDLIGFTEVTITPKMVGKTIPVFTAIEMKTPTFKIKSEYREGSREQAQLKFINLIRRKLGVAGFCRSTDDLLEILEEYQKEITK